MSNSIFRVGRIIIIPAFALLVLVGCGSGRNSLPTSVTIELPDGTTVQAEEGAGVASLANTTWEFFRTAATAQGAAFLTISFGADGNLESFENNTIAQEIFGTTIRFDGQRHSTSQKALEYAASTYGAETSDGTGFTFEGRLRAFAGPLLAGVATATATGTFDPDDADTMTGTFSFITEVTLPIEIEGGNQSFDYDFIARRVIE